MSSLAIWKVWHRWTDRLTSRRSAIHLMKKSMKLQVTILKS